MKKFNEKDVVDSYMLKELLKAKTLYDFIPTANNSKDDQDILDKWKTFFTLKNIPWAVTFNGKTYTMWKKDERLNPAEIKKEQLNPKTNWFKD